MNATSLLALAAAVTTALTGGVLLAFSAFVMTGLRALPPADGAAAMRAINRAAVRPPFMTVLFGSLVLALVTATVALVTGASTAMLAVAAAAAHLLGCVGVTASANVPLNNGLEAALDPATQWRSYVPQWLAWNHVRVLACAVAATLLVLAAR
ncbi:DUF1772 domain-containing protein [Cellulomonas sp. zg-ZUI199]|uniref:DUF1772 domain-containing protein n=1 Tax=Cellulomonas wangleii TaxID=2816956 RepID=A0ABX8D2I9_9CELL|nr:anthrone oxygenase family protein [Cellulomonas wangleii]MBO0923328.1 DUF1772 domain-containing protein [Cellulomonas wangleii]QVI61685.1 DUF1772 domain-containing protein [Cellulomonas wangleii]